MTKQSTNIRLTRQGQAIRRALAERLGVTMSDVIELALRRMAQAEGLTLPVPEIKRKPTPARKTAPRGHGR